MKSLSDILLLGDQRLYQPSSEVTPVELPSLLSTIDDLHDLVLQYRKKYGSGRAIAAPQTGVMKRIVCYNDRERVTMINPVISRLSDEMMELWDDCMSFPNLLVRVKRHQSCTLTFRDPEWNLAQWRLEDDLAELFQHEVDHLDGILATDRAIGERSLRLIKQSP